MMTEQNIPALVSQN